MEGSRNGLAGHSKSRAVDGPAVEAFVGSVVFSKGHLKDMVGLNRTRSWFGESEVVPFEGWRRRPLRFSASPGIFDGDTHAVPAIPIVEVTQNPQAGVVHVHDGGDAFTGADPQHRNVHRIGNGIAVQREYPKRVTR